MTDWLDEINWNEQGLVPVIIQESGTGKVLMHAWMNRESLLQSQASGRTVFWSRSRKQLWTKGESSGHFQNIESIRMDCDGDTLLISVKQEGGIACHTGRAHCFYRELEGDEWNTTEPVLKDPKSIYSEE